MSLGPPNLASTARRFYTPVIHRRYGEPVVTSEFLLADPVPIDTPGRAHHWPASGETLERLPEGTEGADVREGTTSLDLRAQDTTTDPPTRGDSLVVDGMEYQVVEVAPRHVNAAGVVTWRSFVMVAIPARAWP